MTRPPACAQPVADICLGHGPNPLLSFQQPLHRVRPNERLVTMAAPTAAAGLD
jgi:hypothetical protein